MSTMKPAGQDAISIVDSLIQVHFDQANEGDGDGQMVAPFSAADKLHLANRAGVDLEVVETRLLELCEQLPRDDRFAAVPRYRMKAGRNRS